MAQFGISNPLYLDSDEAETNVRRGVATNDFRADPTIDVGQPPAQSAYGLRRPSQAPAPQSKYEIVFDQPNTERPAPTPPSMWGGNFKGESKYQIVFDQAPPQEPSAPPAPKEEDGFFTNIGKSLATGAKSGKVTWSFLADKLAGALGADTSETSRILAEDVKRYKEAWRDPQLQEISKKVDEAPDFASGAFEMLKGMALNPSALPYFLAEQTPTMLAGGVTGKIGQSFTTAALSRAGVKAVEKKAVQTATAGAAINAGATTFGSLGANYTEGLQKFGGDTERASDYAATKTLAELPTNIVAGALIGWTPFSSRLANIGTQATIQGAGGASGAAVAAKAVGEEASRSELLLEFLGEFASAPAEALSLGAGKKGPSPTGGASAGSNSSGELQTITAEEALSRAQARLDFLDRKAEGTKDRKVTGPDGKETTVPGELSQFLSDAERNERNFLRKSMGNAEVIARQYGYKIGDPTKTAPGADGEVPDTLKRDEEVAGFRRLSDNQMREATSSENGVAFAAALFRNATPEDQKFIRQTVERVGNVAAFDAALNDQTVIEKGQGLITQFPEFAELYLQSAKVFASTKPTTSRVKAMPVQQEEGTTNESQTTTSTVPGQPGGAVGGDQVLGTPGTTEAQGAAGQATQPAGAVEQSPEAQVRAMSTRLPQGWMAGNQPNKYGIISHWEPESQSQDIRNKVVSHPALPGLYFKTDNDLFKALKIRKEAVAKGTWSSKPADTSKLRFSKATAPKPTSLASLPSRSEGQKTLRYAGIGSRSAPPEVLKVMSDLAKRLSQMGYTLRSGGAKGADSAFESGAGSAKEIFYASDANDITRNIAKEVHPAPGALTGYTLDLMARNTNQIFGRDLTSPVDFVLTWTPDGAETSSERTRNTGGTGQAIDLASRKGIPVINLARPGWEQKLARLLGGGTATPQQSASTEPQQTKTKEPDVSDRLQKLTLDYQDEIPVTERIEMQNKLAEGKVAEVEKYITDKYASFNEPSKADINGAKRQREFLSKVAERFQLTTDLQEVDTLLSGKPTKNNVDRAVELMQEQAKKQVQALIKAKKPKSAAEVFRRTGLQEQNIFAKGNPELDVGAVFDAAARDVEQENNLDIEAPAPKILKRKAVSKPAPFKFSTKYITDSDFQRVIDLIVASMARGEAGAFDAPKVALSKSKEAQQFLESLPEAKRDQILGRVKEDGETTKGWLGNTSVSDLRSVLQEQRDEGRNFLREEDRLTPEEREAAVRKRAFEAEVYRILNMVNEAQTYRDAIARLRAEQDAIYAALNGTRNVFFRSEKGQIQIYESASPQPEAGFIVGQFESPKNSDFDEVIRGEAGERMAPGYWSIGDAFRGPMQSAAPERMVDMKDMAERGQEALRARAAAITQEIRGLQEKSTREQAKLFRQGLFEIKTRLHNARAMAVRNGLPVSETLEIFDNAIRSIAVLENDKPTPTAKQAIETFEATEPTVVRDLAAEARENALKEAWKGAIQEMRNGNITLGELVNRVRAEGVAVPQEFLSLASELAMRTPLSRHLRQNNTGWTYRSQWAASLFNAARKAKDFGLSNDLVNELNLTDGEKFTYFGWLKDRTKVASRNPVNGANTVEEAFGNFLFAKYSLDQMRDPSLIENDRDRAVLESVFGTPDSMVEAWFEDVYAAQKFDAPMARAAMAGDRIDIPGFANVAKDPMISPADAREYKAWRQRKLQAKIIRAKVIAESAYTKALANIQGLTDEQYEAIKDQLALASLNEKDAVLKNAIELAKKNQQGSPLDDMLSEFVDQVMVDDMSYARTPEEIADAMRRASIQNTQIDYVATRKDFIGKELSGEGESDVIINDDGEYDYEADDQRLAKGKQSGVLTAAIVQAKVKQILSTWKLAPNVEVYQNANALPEPLRSAVIEKLGADWNAKGLYNGEDGTVYLFSDFLLSEGDVEFTLFHETYGHLGLRAFLGSKFDSFLNTAYRTNQRVKALADQKMAEEGLPRLEAIDEALADIAGENTPVAGFKALVGRLIAALRESGFARVADWLSKMTDAEVAWTLKMARETARSGGHKLIEGSPGELRLADERMPYELFAQRNGKTSAYARYNPLTMEWIVFTATGEDIRGDYTSRSMQDYKQVFDLMGQYGKVERRLRSGLYIDDKLPTDLIKVEDPRNVGKVRGLWRTLTQKLQNEYLPVWQYVEALAKQGKIDDRIDVKKALTLYERKTGTLIEDFNKQFVTPMMDALEQAKKLGATNEDLNNWLIARTAEERNRQIAKVNPKNKYGSGMPPNTMRMPDGRVQEGYNQILARMKNTPFYPQFVEIAKFTDIMGVEKVKYEVATGLIGTKDGLARLAAYKHYVNLSGVNSELDETPDLTEMVGTKFNVKGKDKRAMGRVDLAPDVLARTIQAYESSLIRGQKNKVAQTVLALMETNYDPDFVVINEQSYRRQVNKDTGLTDYVLDANYIQRDDVMVAKVNGIPTTIRFKQTGAGTFAEAIHGVVYPKQAGPIMEAVGRYTQFIGQLVTTYNPAWIFVNFTRDVQTMYFNAAADKKITKQMAAEMVKNLRGSVRLAMWVAAEKSPKLRKILGQPRPDLLASYEEMRKEGGLTSFINRKGLEDQVHAIEIALTGNKTPIDRAKALLEFMEVLTLPMEMAPRLAAYHVTRKHGFSKSDAAVFSGDITVNFNMRGQSKEIRQLYLFFNPAIQGTNKMYRLAKEDPKTFAKIAGAWVAFGAAMGMLGRALNDEDDEGISDYDKVPTYKRATSIVLKTDMPGGSIPIPYGWNAFYALGNFMMDSVMGVQPVSTSAKRAAKAAFEAFSPMGGAGLDSKTGLGMLAKGVTPTAGLPVLEYLMNENRFGAPIYKDDKMFGTGPRTPDSHMAFDSVSPISRTLMQGLNSLTGGSSLKEGKIDINPAAVDFAINAVLPGVVAEGYKMASVGIKAAMGEDTKPLPTPIIGRFEARVPEGYDAGAFRRAKELVDTKYKELEFTKDPKVRQEILREYPGIGAAKGVLAATTQEIRRMRSDLAEVENLSNLPDSRKIEIKNKIKKREKELYSRAVKAVMNVGTEENKPFRDVLLASD